MKPAILTGSWQKLVMANYAVDPAVLAPLIPPGVALNFWDNTAYVTLAGFVFSSIKVLGIPVPFHQQVPEINFRFYVKPNGTGQEQRGVVFVRQIVSKPLLAVSANLLYREHYAIMPVKKYWKEETDYRTISYHCKESGKWNSMEARSSGKPTFTQPDTAEEFITVQPYGYTRSGRSRSLQYRVEHPVWQLYPLLDASIKVSFGRLFGTAFQFLEEQRPVSVYLAEGSPVKMRLWGKL